MPTTTMTTAAITSIAEIGYWRGAGSLSRAVPSVTVQFSSRRYLCARKSPRALRPVSQNCPQRCLWNGSSVRLIDDGPLSSFQGRSSSASSFNASLLRAINGVMSLGFVPAGSVSSFSTPQIFREASRLWGLLCLPVSLLGQWQFERALYQRYRLVGSYCRILHGWHDIWRDQAQYDDDDCSGFSSSWGDQVWLMWRWNQLPDLVYSFTTISRRGYCTEHKRGPFSITAW